MPPSRTTRRLLYAVAAIILLAAIVSNLVIFFGLITDDLKWHFGELQDFRPHLHIPGKRRKPWHSDEQVDEALEAVDQHPIASLMQEADQAWQSYEGSRSKSFRETVSKYRERYHRHPPPGFREWYKYARKRNVHNIDDFEQIMGDIRPFWAVEPRAIRNLAANMWRDRDQGVAGIHIRNGKIVKETFESWRSNALVTLIKRFVTHLPDMDIAMNRLDQPRVVVPWQDLQDLLNNETQSRATPPQATNEFTKGMNDFAIFTDEEPKDKEDPGWYPWHGKQYMEVVKTACPPESPAVKDSATVEAAESLFKSTDGGLVTNFNLSTDLCTVGPHLADKHGILYASSTLIPTKRLVPIFGECKISVNNDILFPANMYWLHDKRYDYDKKNDIEWEDKKDKMIWRGVTSGGTQNADNWRRMHRQRLVLQVNSTEMADTKVRILTEHPERKHEYVNFPDYHPSTFAAEHADVGFTETPGCVPQECDFYNDVLTLKPEMSQGEQFKNKFLVDVDGHSFSGRWHAFLESKALGIKATIFREWHDSRLFAWRHFVPMDNRYDDVYTLLTYFLGIGTAPERRVAATAGEHNQAYVPRHETEGKKIADQGREWAKKVLRREDIEVWKPSITVL